MGVGDGEEKARALLPHHVVMVQAGSLAMEQAEGTGWVAATEWAVVISLPASVAAAVAQIC